MKEIVERDRSDDEVLLHEPFLLMTFCPKERLIHLEWNGHATSAQYRSSLELAVNFVSKHDVHLWLADLRGMTAILQSDEKWANEHWFPKLFATPLEKMAILHSKDYFNQTSVARSFRKVNSQLTFKVADFNDMHEAMAWLKKREAVSA
jgi:hypothetical protein